MVQPYGFRKTGSHAYAHNNGAVSSAPDERRPGDLVEHVADDLRAAEHIVEVNPHAPSPAKAGDVMQVVVPDHRASHGPVSSCVYRAGVVGLEADVMDLVEFDRVVVSAEHEGHVRRIVDKVMCRAQPHA